MPTCMHRDARTRRPFRRFGTSLPSHRRWWSSAPRSPRLRPQLSLVGTVGGGEESFGIFVDPNTKAALRLKIGEDYQGWKLRSVQGREVMLERDMQSAVLSLPQPGIAAPGIVRGQAENAAQQPLGFATVRDPRQ